MKPKHDVVPKQFVLCLIGAEKFHVEKEIIKFLRKHLETSTKLLPLHSVHKKRGQSFAFLNFVDMEQMKQFQALFGEEMPPNVLSRYKLNPCNNMKKVESKSFKNVKSAETMLEEGTQRKERAQAAVTDEDILREV